MQTTPLGTLLRDHRERLAMTQEAVVTALTPPGGDPFITQAHVSAIELGRRGPSREVLARLADLYQLSADQRGQLLSAPISAAA